MAAGRALRAARAKRNEFMMDVRPVGVVAEGEARNEVAGTILCRPAAKRHSVGGKIRLYHVRNHMICSSFHPSPSAREHLELLHPES